MEKIEKTRTEIIGLYVAQKKYVETVGKTADSPAWACDSAMNYAPNVKSIKDHDKAIKKMDTALQRAVLKASNNNAMIYEDGEKKGSHILGADKELLFTPEQRNLVNDEINILKDKYDEDISDFMDTPMSYYIEKATVVPEAMSVEFRNALALILPSAVKPEPVPVMVVVEDPAI